MKSNPDLITPGHIKRHKFINARTKSISCIDSSYVNKYIYIYINNYGNHRAIGFGCLKNNKLMIHIMRIT